MTQKPTEYGISKPKSMRAVMEHNLAWFNHFIFGGPLPDFTRPNVPAKEKKKDDEDVAEGSKRE